FSTQSPMVYSFHMSRNDFGVWRSLIHFIYIICPHHKRTTFMELIISGVDYDDFWLMCIYYFLHCVIPYCVSSYVQCFFFRVRSEERRVGKEWRAGCWRGVS